MEKNVDPHIAPEWEDLLWVLMQAKQPKILSPVLKQ